jgi:ethanolamine utilization microcompartment shell protein EutL
MSQQQNKQAKQAAEQAFANYVAFKAGRKLSEMNDAEQQQALALHAAFCEADDVVNAMDEAVKVSGLNVGLILRGIDYAAPDGVIDYDGVCIWITGSSVAGSAEALEMLACHLHEACDSNLTNQQEWRILDNGTEFNDFAEKALQRSIEAAERQAAKIRAGIQG